MFLSNSRFVLAILAVSSFGNFQSLSAELTAINFMYGGYISTTDVDETAQKDLHQTMFEDTLGSGYCSEGPNNAEDVFEGGPLKDIPTYKGTNSRIFDIFSSFYKIKDITDNYARKWNKAALSGGTFFDNDFGNWGTMTEGPPCRGQVESAKKGTAYLSGLLEVNQYMEQASALIKNDCVFQSNSCDDAVIAWNNAAAFFVGSKEGAKGGTDDYDGKILYSLGNNQCSPFRKCGVNTDFSKIIGKTNIVSIALFQKGAGLVFVGDVESLQKTIKEINTQILITFIQGSLRYGYRLGDYQETPGVAARSIKSKDLGIGATFAACAAPQLWAISKRAGTFVSEQYKIGPNGPASQSEFDFVGVRNAFECNYKKLGISCDEIDALWEDSDDTTVPKSCQCTDLRECKKRRPRSIPSKKDCKPYTKKRTKKISTLHLNN